ncbi:MAG: transposase, partial [Acidimicrobiales bacterium]|nr:transposase [Acidimicrobiales bacterium]
DGVAQVAECTYQDRRLIVRRTRLTGAAQRRLWPDWRHFGFLTDLDGDMAEVDEFHRDHATVELAIRDLKEGAGMDHCPSGDFSANSAWLQCAVLAHNLIRWTATLGQPGPVDRLTVARTVRVRLITVPGRLVNRAGIYTLRGPAGWPWAALFTGRLQRLRALRPVPG